MKNLRLAFGTLLVVLSYGHAASTYSPMRPPAVPLAVKSPYLNVWLNGQTGDQSGVQLAKQWPSFWTGRSLPWKGLIKVDGELYNWMGEDQHIPSVHQYAMEYTSTSTVFRATVAGKVDMTIKFLSPTYRRDIAKQSVAASYLEVTVISMIERRQFSVQLYSDVSGEWATGDTNAALEWSKKTRDGIIYQKFWRKKQKELVEANEQASWGSWYYATQDKFGASYQSGDDVLIRRQFAKHGHLRNETDTDFRALHDGWVAFGVSHDLGDIGDHPTSVLYAVGYTPEIVVSLTGKTADPKHIPLHWKSDGKEDDVITGFFHNYKDARYQCNTLDRKIREDSIDTGGENYAAITALAFRQVLGAMQFANTQKSSYIFVKDIGSDGGIQTVNNMFSILPLVLYLDPNYIPLMLDPLLEYQQAERYPNDWAMHDMGRYPRALGYPEGNDEPMPVEDCSNMIIIMYAYYRRTKDDKYLDRHWNLLEKWGRYLLNNAKIPSKQLSADEFRGRESKLTNLAIKGIIALQALGEVAVATNRSNVGTDFFDISKHYFSYWKAHSIFKKGNKQYISREYDKPESQGLLHNLYADKLLDLNFVPKKYYNMLSDYFKDNQKEYGVEFKANSSLARLDWDFFAAAVSKPKVKKTYISKIAKWINETPTTRALTDLYDPVTGDYPEEYLEVAARPVVGGVFALLGLLDDD